MDIHRCTANTVMLQALVQVLFADNRATGCIDQISRRLHYCKTLLVDKVPVRRSVCHMNGYHISFSKNFLRRSTIGGMILSLHLWSRPIHIIIADLHAKGQSLLRHSFPDTTESQHSQPLSFQAHIPFTQQFLVTSPVSSKGTVIPNHIPRNGENQCHCHLACGSDDRTWRIENHDTTFGTRIHINVVESTAKIPHDFQPWCMGKKLFIAFHIQHEKECITLANGRDNFVPIELPCFWSNNPKSFQLIPARIQWNLMRHSNSKQG